jgi:hypothetical protein
VSLGQILKIRVDRRRLKPGKKLSATQELGGVFSKKSRKGEIIRPVAFGTVKFVKPPYMFLRSTVR